MGWFSTYTNAWQRQILSTAQHKYADDGMLAVGLRNILEPPTDGGYLCWDPISTYYIFTSYDLTRGITAMIQKRLNELKQI